MNKNTHDKAQNVSKLSCWIITEKEKTGTLNPCIGLANAVGFEYPEVKTLSMRKPYAHFTPYIRYFKTSMLTPDSEDINTGDWPDLIISSGRKAVVPALWVKKQSKNQAKLVHIQDPKAHRSDFDLILAPVHDQISGRNVVSTRINIHHVTEEKLASEKEKFSKRYKTLPEPRVGVLIGGSSKHHTMTAEITAQLAEQICSLADQGYGVMITASRRTGEENAKILKTQLRHYNIDFWDGTGDNPYFGILAWSDVVLTTEDSVSMTSEAIATGKPVYTIPLQGGSPRLDVFHQTLQKYKHTRRFLGRIEDWVSTPNNDMANAVSRVVKLLAS